MDTVGFTRLVSPKSSESEPSDCKVAGLGGWPAVRVGQFTCLHGTQKLAGPQTGTVELKFLVRSSVYPFTVNHLNSL